MEVAMLTKAVPFVATLLGAISCAAHATPIELGDAALDRIVASDGSGNGNNNSGNNNGNSNVANNNGNNNSGSNNGNNNASSGNGNNNSTDGNGNDAPDPRAAPEEVLSVKAVLRDMLSDIITFDDGGAVADVLPPRSSSGSTGRSWRWPTPRTRRPRRHGSSARSKSSRPRMPRRRRPSASGATG
jgi:hypothetical protein